MRYQAVFAAIASLDNSEEIGEAIKLHVSTILEEKMQAQDRVKKLEKSLETLTDATEVDGADLQTKLDNAISKASEAVKANKELQQKFEGLETRATEAEAKAKEFESKQIITEAGVSLGLQTDDQRTVFKTLIKDIDLSKFEFGDDGFKIEGKSAKEWLESNPAIKPFLPALFAVGQENAGAADKQDNTAGNKTVNTQKNVRAFGEGPSKEPKKGSSYLDRRFGHLTKKTG